MSAPEVVCGQVEGRCRCVEAPHEDGPHRCECGGSWHYAPDGDVVMDAVPGSAPDWPGPAFMGVLDPITAMVRFGSPIRAGRGPIQFVRFPSLGSEGSDDGEDPIAEDGDR